MLLTSNTDSLSVNAFDAGYSAMVSDSHLETDRDIAILKAIRAKIVAAIELAQKFDLRLAGDLGSSRRLVEERLANCLLARELAQDHKAGS